MQRELFTAGIPEMQAVLAEYAKNYQMRQMIEIIGGTGLLVAGALVLLSLLIVIKARPRKTTQYLGMTGLIILALFISLMGGYTLWNRSEHTIQMNDYVLDYVQETENAVRKMRDDNGKIYTELKKIMDVLNP